MADQVGVTIHNINNESMLDYIEGIARETKCTTTSHKHMTQLKVKGTQKQIDAFVKLYRG